MKSPLKEQCRLARHGLGGEAREYPFNSQQQGCDRIALDHRNRRRKLARQEREGARDIPDRERDLMLLTLQRQPIAFELPVHEPALLRLIQLGLGVGRRRRLDFKQQRRHQQRRLVERLTEFEFANH